MRRAVSLASRSTKVRTIPSAGSPVLHSSTRQHVALVYIPTPVLHFVSSPFSSIAALHRHPIHSFNPTPSKGFTHPSPPSGC
uniref:Uncharacterized protein n=1 Tax=Aegilops tauschii subsp. strangulata TaxID=200361 RepID=A0A452ZCN1_AEGTS